MHTRVERRVEAMAGDEKDAQHGRDLGRLMGRLVLALGLMWGACSNDPDAQSGADVTSADAVSPGDADLDRAPDDGDPANALPPAAVSGHVRIFGPPGGPLEGAEVYVLEHPDLRAFSDAEGRFELFDVPAGDVTLVMLADGYPENQLGTHRLAGEDLDGFDFQAVSDGIFGIFATLAETVPDPERCQISTTVTRWFEGTLPVVHGEPGVTVTIEPQPPGSTGAIYFNEDVLPTPGLTETTVDGGVVWTNVPPGEYVLRAHKEGVSFEEVRIRCRPNILANAGPPRGLQALVVGSGY